jgi:hypothetical protein
MANSIPEFLRSVGAESWRSNYQDAYSYKPHYMNVFNVNFTRQDDMVRAGETIPLYSCSQRAYRAFLNFVAKYCCCGNEWARGELARIGETELRAYYLEHYDEMQTSLLHTREFPKDVTGTLDTREKIVGAMTGFRFNEKINPTPASVQGEGLSERLLG